MAKRIKERVEVGVDEQGQVLFQWASGSTRKELHDSIVRVYLNNNLLEGLVETGVEQVEVPSTPQNTFRDFVENWMVTYKQPRLKPTTYKGYESMLRAHLYPAFAEREISAITTSEVQTFLNERKHLAFKTLHTMLIFLGEIFKDALEDGLVMKNPTDSRKLTIPSTRKTERESLTLEQVQSVIEQVEKLPLTERRLMALLLFTGMRRGEVLGLRWEDIDFDAGLIYVQRNVTFPKNQPTIGTPKSEKGKRKIPLEPELVRLLAPIQSTGYVVGGDKPFTHVKYRRMWERLEKTLNLYGATAHIFRHTYLTMANLQIGVKP